MKLITIAQLRSYNPCYNPIEHLPENWTGTVLDILKHETIPHSDKLWAVLRSDLLSDKTMRIFALSCAKSCLQYAQDDQKEVLEGVFEVVRRFINGEATEEELSAAESAADSAAYSAVGAAASAAWSAARSAAYSAVGAAESAAWSAVGAARNVARSAAQKTQIEQLIKLVKFFEE